MKPPRIAIDVTPLLYTANGIGRSTRALVESMLKMSSDLDIVLFGRRLGGASLCRQGLPARAVHLRLPRRTEPLIKRLGLFELACNADLYHATDFYAPLKRPENAVATIHDVIFLRNPESMVDHLRLAKWTGNFARSARAVITCSNWCKQDISNTMQVDPARIHVIYWGVDRDVFRPESDTPALWQRLQTTLGISRPYFLAVSCSMERKNTPRLLRAYSDLLKQGASNDLVVAWNPPAEIRSMYASELNNGRIRFTGRLSDESLGDLYCGATAMIFPSLDEGFGLPVLEAMSCGTPVITSNTSCLPEIAGGAAILVNPSDQAAITRAMAQFENRDESLRRLSQQGLNHSRNFSWEHCAAQTLGVYRSLVG